MTWEMPKEWSELYFAFDWAPGVVLCIHRTGHAPRGERTHDLEEKHVASVLYAMGQTEDKKALFEGMVKSGVVRQVKAVDPGLDKFRELLRAHDWTYSMSDDSRTCRRGEAEEEKIKREMAGHPEREALYEKWKMWAWGRGPKPEGA